MPPHQITVLASIHSPDVSLTARRLDPFDLDVHSLLDVEGPQRLFDERPRASPHVRANEGMVVVMITLTGSGNVNSARMVANRSGKPVATSIPVSPAPTTIAVSRPAGGPAPSSLRWQSSRLAAS